MPPPFTVTVPAGATTGPISVTTPGGTATSAASFTVIPPPTISSFTPITAGAGVGASITLTGTNFSNASAVQFNGVAATTYTVVNATTITVIVPAGATTGPISVTTLAAQPPARQVSPSFRRRPLTHSRRPVPAWARLLP